MSYRYTQFIPQNTMLTGATGIGIYDKDGKKVHTMSLGRLGHSTANKLYSFGVLSDIHLFDNLSVTWQPNPKFDNALTHFENQGCNFCIVCGDLTQTGFYKRTKEDDASTTYADDAQMRAYKEICANHSIPIYEVCGNHESYYGMQIENNLEKWKNYSGNSSLTYTITKSNDLFIFVSQPRDTWVMNDDELQWLYNTLEENRNKRCFVTIHSNVPDDSGNPLNARPSSIFKDWGASKTEIFKRLMAHYKNTVLFHGHTHMKFESQQYDKMANYTEANGFRSIHVPSCGGPRTLKADGTWGAGDDESQGYIVDVYNNYIVLNGLDLINSKPIPLGTYKIDTTLQNIEANTFTDSTGTINTNK